MENLNNIRKILRVCDKVGIPTQFAYEKYYKYILKKLNPVLIKAYSIYDKNESKLPDQNIKYVWVMWWQGIDNAPDIIKVNIKRLQKTFGENRVKIITRSNYKKYTDISNNIVNLLKEERISFTLWSDIIRYNLLKNNGGLWIDSTVLVSKKIKNIENLIFDSEYFSLCNSQKDYHYISHALWTGWFVAGNRNYSLFKFMDIFFDLYFKTHSKSIDYYLVDDATFYFFSKNKSFNNKVNAISKVWDPYLFSRNLTKTFNPKIYFNFETERKFCIQKITYKVKMKNIPKDALFYRLMGKN